MRATFQARPPAILLCLVLVETNCGTAGVRASDPYRADSAYVYGRFWIDALAMVFSIRCRDGAGYQTYQIEFSHDHRVQMMRLPVTTCQLEEIVLGNVKSPASFRMLRNEVLSAGGVYYIGDFSATGKREDNYPVTRWSWKLNDARDNYRSTTAEMKRTFPQFSAADTEDRVTH